MPHADGTDGSGADAGYLKNTPIEITEAEVPIRFRHYGLASGSGGAGRWRGGLATRMDFEAMTPETRVTARNRDRCRFRPWGILGGRAGAPSRMVVNPGRADERVLNNVDTFALNPGDVVSITSPGGGGRGDPFAREPERVLRDVVRGYVTPGAAEADYGVVIRDGAVDAPATAALRDAPRPRLASHFHFGPERDGFERVWDAAAYVAMTEILAGLPIHWRHFVKRRLMEAVTSEGGGGEAVRAAWEALLSRLPQMRAVSPPVARVAAE